RLLPTLGLAAGTTVAGLGGLAWASFPGIREIALFSAVGVFTALLATAFFAMRLRPAESPSRVASRLSFWLEKAYLAQRRRPWIALAGFITSATIATWGITQVRFAPGL